MITTRTYRDRLETLAAVREAGIHVCCGGIVGMGEVAEDRVALLHTLATLDPHPESVPIENLVQVEGTPTPDALAALRNGVVLNDGPTLPAEVEPLDAQPAWLWPRDPPVRFRKTVPDAWLRLTIREGRNRQVRRMTAAVGLPTLRLVRERVGDWTLDGLAPGAWRVASRNAP